MADKDIENNISTLISEAQLEKLKLEIEELKRKSNLQQKIISFLPLLTIIIAVGGLWYNFYQFSRSQESQTTRENNSRLDDFQKPFYQKQLELYFEATNYASVIATLPPNSEERKKAEIKFKQLGTGSLYIVEDKLFEVAKLRFDDCVSGRITECEEEPRKSIELKSLSLELARTAKESTIESWKINSRNLNNQGRE